jgi:hypothetical protein
MRQGEIVAIPEAASLLAGFILAHAAWSVSDLPEGDFLVPLAIVETGSERKLVRFDSETQEQAIAECKAFACNCFVLGYGPRRSNEYEHGGN